LKKILFLFFSLLLFAAVSCNKKADDKSGDKTTGSEKREFGWKDDITAGDIPDFPVKGMLGGREVQFAYINFENWRGSKDNVLNFSLVKPAQTCGFIENFEGFTLMNKGGEIKQGPWLKAKFADDPAAYKGSYRFAGTTSADQWNCALEIESKNEKTVKGKIALFFNDASKSWVAGRFEAALCNN
jgi:hypothetical protein